MQGILLNRLAHRGMFTCSGAELWMNPQRHYTDRTEGQGEKVEANGTLES
jgi:hypothetical protein